MPDKLNDPSTWLFIWTVAAILIGRKSDLVPVRLACAVVAAIPAGFLVYQYEHSLGAAIAMAIGLFVFLVFALIVLELPSLASSRSAADQKRESTKEVDCSAEFQERRRKAGKMALLPIALLVIPALIGIWVGRYGNEPFFGFGAAIVWLTWICFRYYRCPGCNMIPISRGSSSGGGSFSLSIGVHLDPEFCWSCGVRLKPKSS